MTARTEPRTVADLIGDLARLGDAQRALLGGYTIEEVDFDSADAAALADEFVERLTERLCARFTNNPMLAARLYLTVCEPEAMTSADRQAVAPFAPFLAAAAPVIGAAAALESALDAVLFPPEADKAREEESRRFHAHLDLECLHGAFEVAIASLEALIADLDAGRVTLPPCLEGAALAAAEAEHALYSRPRPSSEASPLVAAHDSAVIEAGGALYCRAEPYARRPVAAASAEAAIYLPAEWFVAADVTSMPLSDEAFELAEARVIAADAALVEARAAVTSALCDTPEKGAAFVAVVADTEAARRAALEAERQRNACEGELGCDNGADEHSLSVASDKLISAHLSLLNLSLREAAFVADAIYSLE